MKIKPYDEYSLGDIENYFFPLFDKGGVIEIPSTWRREAMIAANSYVRGNAKMGINDIYTPNFTLKFI